MQGIIYKTESKDFYVLSESGEEIRCSLKGKFKQLYGLKKNKLSVLDIAAVGDSVEYAVNSDGTGTISRIYERRNYLSRKAPKVKGGLKRGERYEQILASNLDFLCLVSSIYDPPLNNRIIDRLLVSAESSQIGVKIIINKTDLADKEEVDYWVDLYESAGYRVYPTNALNKKGTSKLKKDLSGGTAVFWGPSGVGKSSLLNAMYPELSFKTGEVSAFSNKGRHTTVTSILKRIDPSTIIIDTPGIRELDPYGIKREDLGHYFREFAKFSKDCRFNTCTHMHEPGCRVLQAVEEEKISPERYLSYLSILDTIEDDIYF